MNFGFRYTGHPFIDVGVATITAFAHQQDSKVNYPDDISEDHLDRLVEFIFPIYLNRTMINFVSGVLFTNFYPFNQSVVSKPQFDKVREDSLWQFLLALYKPNVDFPDHPKIREALEPPYPNDICVFSSDQPIARLSRELIPMTLGRDQINFVPEGRPHLPISDWCLLALFALPFGGLKSRGKVWIVHSNDPEVIQYIAVRNLQRNRRDFQIQGLEKRPNYRFASTHLLRDLADAQGLLKPDTSLTAYLFSNANQGGSIQINHLPSDVIGFVRSAQRGTYQDAWNQIVRRANANVTDVIEKDGEIVHQVRNYFYEDLFTLPQNAVAFLRCYLLRRPDLRHLKKDKADPRFAYSPLGERDIVNWELIKLFMKKVMRMRTQRIDQIKALADRLAQYIAEDDPRLFKKLFLTRTAYHLRRELILAATRSKKGLIPTDEFTALFFLDNDEEDDDQRFPRQDFYLARDLLFIRIIERLRELEWYQQNEQIVQEIDEAFENQTGQDNKGE